MPYTWPRIVRAIPGTPSYTVRITCDHGSESFVDVSRFIATFHVYTPLRQDPSLFRQVRVGEYGADIVWTDALDMSADTLWRLAQEQADASA